MKFYNEDDMTEENFNKFLQEIDKIQRESEKRNKLLNENTPLSFSSGEEFIKYHNAIPLQEWENNIKEKYGI